MAGNLMLGEAFTPESGRRPGADRVRDLPGEPVAAGVSGANGGADRAPV